MEIRSAYWFIAVNRYVLHISTVTRMRYQTGLSRSTSEQVNHGLWMIILAGESMLKLIYCCRRFLSLWFFAAPSPDWILWKCSLWSLHIHRTIVFVFVHLTFYVLSWQTRLILYYLNTLQQIALKRQPYPHFPTSTPPNDHSNHLCHATAVVSIPR